MSAVKSRLSRVALVSVVPAVAGFRVAVAKFAGKHRLGGTRRARLLHWSALCAAVMIVVAMLSPNVSADPPPIPNINPANPSGPNCDPAASANYSGDSPGFAYSNSFFSKYVTAPVTGAAEVTNGDFFNVFLYPNPESQTWDQYMAGLPANQQGPTSEALDAITGALVCSSYFDMLTQYGIEPPTYSGDEPTVSDCVSNALNDAESNNNVISYATMRSFASCEGNGAQQVNIFIAPGISASNYGQDETDMCSAGTDGSGSTGGYHGWGLGVPNFTVVPTSPACQKAASGNLGAGKDMHSLSHEMVELLSDPGGFGWNHGGIGGGTTTYDQGELGDICSSVGIHPTQPVPFPSTGALATLGITNPTVAPYWSDQDNACEPTSIMNDVLVPLAGSPSASFSNDGDNVVVPIHLSNPPAGVVDSVELDIVTGDDNLNKCSLANVTTQINLSGNVINLPQDNANEGAGWGNNTLHAVLLNVPPDLPVGDITQVTLGFSTTCVFGDTWDVAGFEVQADININPGPCIPVTELLLNTGNGTAIGDDGWPGLHRFKGGHTDSFTLPLPTAPAADATLPVTGLTLIATTGHDNINEGDQANAQVNTPTVPGSGPSGEFDNINQSAEWNNYTSSGAIQLLQLPGAVFTPGTTAGQLHSFTIYTNFPGGLFGDNWDLLSVVLFAELKCPPSPGGPIVGAVQSTVTGLALSPNPASPSQQVTYTASVNPIPDGGTVGFSSDGVPIPGCSTEPVDTTTGFTTCTTSAAAQPGSYAVVAAYSSSGDGTFSASTSNTLYQQVLAPTSTTLTSSPNPALAGDQVTYTASVNPVPNRGTMLFTDNGLQIPSCDSVEVNSTTGQAMCAVTYTRAQVGDHSIVATFSGDLTFAPSVSGSFTQHILTPAQALALTISTVDSLESAGVLNSGQANSLTVKLNHAIDSLLNGPNKSTVCNQLDSFINEVNAYVQGGTLTPAQSALLLDGPLGIYAIEMAIPCDTPSPHIVVEWLSAPVVGSWPGTAINYNGVVRRGMIPKLPG